jgi:hypothetical protein
MYKNIFVVDHAVTIWRNFEGCVANNWLKYAAKKYVLYGIPSS